MSIIIYSYSEFIVFIFQLTDGKPIMYEKAFLQDVAMQNYSRYNVSFAALERLPIMRGQALAINSTRWLSSTVGDYQAVLLNSSTAHQVTTTYSPPHWDPLGKGETSKFTLLPIMNLFYNKLLFYVCRRIGDKSNSAMLSFGLVGWSCWSGHTFSRPSPRIYIL